MVLQSKYCLLSPRLTLPCLFAFTSIMVHAAILVHTNNNHYHTSSPITSCSLKLISHHKEKYCIQLRFLLYKFSHFLSNKYVHESIHMCYNKTKYTLLHQFCHSYICLTLNFKISWTAVCLLQPLSFPWLARHHGLLSYNFLKLS